MHLTSLTLRGFKSFASATTFEFTPGINAVVGPNGSGKSNIMDALAWVMGSRGRKLCVAVPCRMLFLRVLVRVEPKTAENPN
uniref:AAA family ATPase n=1 Tax=Rothia dentocariosa TaxID=2047 RepID=UPI003FA3C003